MANLGRRAMAMIPIPFSCFISRILDNQPPPGVNGSKGDHRSGRYCPGPYGGEPRTMTMAAHPQLPPSQSTSSPTAINHSTLKKRSAGQWTKEPVAGTSQTMAKRIEKLATSSV
ncbi:hypothetical protein CHGG_00500 [Chaetomium globosum CBS 148.51]|uniref:Uncharacterized protein n=1 Tax=Chaetomium globosum (strain ATCC 6205 / CBS 148.51 / DSM 1962 / NBRC 6347 / NRRL 1970) TaxID=306901 RepID=Q2HH04_CHAGB|nr:uncharacterized protein CHGG_00500 [Chaetomium globosum CBS 148.51]EAQ92265.1 hypothetical protein CHGG_00500 [Chaetomium globosum CBS 148.51]